MSRLEINADIDSSIIAFAYAGKDLLTPLEELRTALLEDVEKLRRQLDPKTAQEPVPTMAGLLKTTPDADLKQKIKLALADAFEAQLWASECRRTPEQIWRLDMARLRWIYRHQAPK